MPEEQLAGLRELLDALAANGLVDAPQPKRARQIVLGFRRLRPGGARGARDLRGSHAPAVLRDARTRRPARNANWEAIGYPGPCGRHPRPTSAPKTISVTRPADAGLELTGRRRRRRLGLRRRRRRRASRDGGQGRGRARGGRLLQRGRLQPARDVGLRAPLPREAGVSRRPTGGSALMDGREPRRRLDGQLDQLPAAAAVGARGVGARARPRRARRHPTSTASSTPCSERVNVNDRCSDLQRARPDAEGARARSSASRRQRITRNADESKYDADLAGLMGFGDQTGSKLGTLKTWLQDAADARRALRRRLPRRAGSSSRTAAPPASRAT